MVLQGSVFYEKNARWFADTRFSSSDDLLYET